MSSQALSRANTPFELFSAALAAKLDLSCPMVDVLAERSVPARQQMEARALLSAKQPSVGLVLLDDRLQADLGRLFGKRELLDMMKAWCAQKTQSASSPPEPTQPIDLARFGIPDLEAWDLNVIDPRWPPGTQLVDILDHGFLRKEAFSTHASRAAFIASLDTFERRLKMAREQLGEQLPTQLPSGFGPLDELLTRIAPVELPLRVTYPPSILRARTLLRRTTIGVEFEVRWVGESGPTVVSWPFKDRTFDPGALSCECEREMCAHVAASLQYLRSSPPSSLVELFRSVMLPAWELVLSELEAPVVAEPLRKPVALNVDFSTHSLIFSVSNFTRKGTPSPRRRRIYHLGRELSRLTGQDAELARAAMVHQAVSGERSGDLMLTCAGFPRVFWEQEPRPVPCELCAPRVAFEETPDGVRAKVNLGEQPYRPRTTRGFESARGVVVPIRESARLALYLLPHEVHRLALAIERHGAEFPREAMARLSEQLPRLEATAEVQLPDDMKGDERVPLDEVVVQVRGAAAGYQLFLRAAPLEGGALFGPGEGSPIAASFDGQRRAWTRRDPDAELARAGQVMSELGLPASSGFEWTLEPGDKAVEVLRRVHHLSTQGLRVEWPQRRPRFTSPADLKSLSLKVSRSHDWFGLDGQATIDGRRVALAELLEAARARRQWVRVSEDDFVQLSKTLLDSLTPLAHLGESGKPATLTLATVPIIEALATDVEDFQAIAAWTKLVERMKQAHQKTFEVPPGVKTELRDYQREGFLWLARLAEWGAGAVLADDMGLGKTLQALVLLAARASLGPALVVAPSSVLHTWRTEAQRHVPSTLRLSLFHEGSRELGALGPSDVIVVSWALLTKEIECFEKARFATVIFDEAHAMKNADTFRAKAAHRLDADFRVALSGTPVENHVGELWSLFRGVLPALLGSEDSFRRRFGAGSPAALSALSVLVRPFVLRRTKSLVAKELPPRTDLDVVVPLSPEERALYDDLRLTMLREFGTVTGASKRFEVLAALTQLRLSACHPALVAQGWKGPTSKLARLLELVRDLTSSGHRMLVFSQFTSHLALVEKALKKEGVRYSYLDGSLPPTQRQQRVERFQAGKGGDVFLISLKAGGTGLTLTHADYVIHLDPWWNPAVEDQASDRAHRIGQTKPVTVYRLIAQGTVEEKMLTLHRDKRAMVDALLAGTEAAASLTPEDIMGFLRTEGT